MQRFLSEDPTGFGAGDTNLYRYTSNSPIIGNDPTGLGDEVVTLDASLSKGTGYDGLQLIPGFDGHRASGGDTGGTGGTNTGNFSSVFTSAGSSGGTTFPSNTNNNQQGLIAKGDYSSTCAETASVYCSIVKDRDPSTGNVRIRSVSPRAKFIGKHGFEGHADKFRPLGIESEADLAVFVDKILSNVKTQVGVDIRTGQSAYYDPDINTLIVFKGRGGATFRPTESYLRNNFRSRY